MQVVLDIEANGLENPTHVWVCVCQDILTKEFYIFRHLSTDEEEKNRFREFIGKVDQVIGHNILGYDIPVIGNVLGIHIPIDKCIDTLILSKLTDYSRDGHSIEAYGLEFGYPKIAFNSFSKYSKEMEDYCVRDVEIGVRVYSQYQRFVDDPLWRDAITTEHRFQQVVNQLHSNGFSFNTDKCTSLLTKVEKELAKLDAEIEKEFPPKEVIVREFCPKLTKHGTISKSSVPRVLHDRIHEFEAGKTYPLTKLVPFNPSSVKQIVDVLHQAGWSPTAKTKTHIQVERDLNRLKYQKNKSSQVDLEIQACHTKLYSLSRYGWKINEENLATLPDTAPSPARTLAKRILLESRRRTLTEWISLVKDGRIHGKFYGIGAWTHRMSHQAPNTANIPGAFNIDGSPKLYGNEMRALWQAPKNRLLVGVDAEGIQLRIFAHYIDDAEFTRSLVEGKKDDKSDPHSLNQRILGSVCPSRAAAKRFIYALLLGAGLGKLAEILGCSRGEAQEALDRLLERYSGFARLKQDVIPNDAQRGWFSGLDGRKVRIPGSTAGERKHLCMSGYLQNGEAIVMKKACLLWHEMAEEEFDDEWCRQNSRLFKRTLIAVGAAGWSDYVRSTLYKLVNFVHDEWQTETVNDMKVALKVAQLQADSLRLVGERLNLKCPLAGSFWNEDHKDYTIGTNWSVTH